MTRFRRLWRIDNRLRNTTFQYCVFTGDRAMHALCICIALHLHIGSKMNIEHTGVFWFAMQCLFLSRKGIQ